MGTAKLTSCQDGNIRAGFEKAQQRSQSAVGIEGLLGSVEITVDNAR
ncbi:MAG: hypothetical protein LRY74_02240 [Shewanella xiamenensis]|nr:hypothetical protein [Shewanella xiamenensis]